MLGLADSWVSVSDMGLGHLGSANKNNIKRVTNNTKQKQIHK